MPGRVPLPRNGTGLYTTFNALATTDILFPMKRGRCFWVLATSTIISEIRFVNDEGETVGILNKTPGGWDQGKLIRAAEDFRIIRIVNTTATNGLLAAWREQDIPIECRA